MKLSITDQLKWLFVNGKYEEDDDGNISSQKYSLKQIEEGISGYIYAFYRKRAYIDLKVKLHLFLKAWGGEAGFIFRAKDPSHFYMLHFPSTGTTYRAQNFWVALSKMDGDGYLKIVKIDLVKRVDTFAKKHNIVIDLKGDWLKVTIDKTGFFEAKGIDSYPGRIGLALIEENHSISNVEIEGSPLRIRWDDSLKYHTNWFHPCHSRRFGKVQLPLYLLRMPSGNLILFFASSEEPYEKTNICLTKSKNNGRDWSEPEMWTKKESFVGFQFVFHVFPDGKLICIAFNNKTNKLKISESGDEGVSWSSFKESAFQGNIPQKVKLHFSLQTFLNLNDDSTLMFLYGEHDSKDESLDINTWGSYHCQAFCSRSIDSGFTWSEPTNLDRVRNVFTGEIHEGCMDFTEVSAIQLNDRSIRAYIRPIYSPWMWETVSYDSGVTWEKAVRGPFPGYAAPNMVKTADSKIVIAHRIPALTINISHNEAITWDAGTIIDPAGGNAMGSMIEVEPGIILYIYGDTFKSYMRAQFIRITQDSIVPQINMNNNLL